MAAITDPKFFALGKIVYHVYGHLVPVDTVDIHKHVQKYICLGSVDDDPEFRKVPILKDGLKERMFKSHMYMGDIGIGRSYNLNRVFASMSDALEFIVQIQTGMMELESDQRQLDYYRSAEYEEEQRRFMHSMW